MGGIGIVAVDEHIGIGIDFPKHGANDVALSLPLLHPHNRPRRLRLLYRMIR